MFMLKAKNFKEGIEYVAGYYGRPSIMENRVINYDEINVNFCCNYYKDNS